MALFFHAIITLLLCPLTMAGNHTDHEALMAIKSSIIHDPQRVFDTWNTSLHFCQWQGVICGLRHRRVTELNFGSRGIVGSLPPQIGNLSFLKFITLNNNTFTGVIPLQIGHLFRLQRLNLINNSFHGEVPASLSNCTRLAQLVLHRNNLTGQLPPQLSLLAKLEALSVGANGFIGQIPTFLSNLTSLRFLSAGDNHLVGSIPHALGQLRNLEVIGFESNKLYGTIPSSLYNLTNLIAFTFHDNQISGDLPKDIGLQLPKILVFSIWGNKYTGSIPFSFSNCTNLEELDLSVNGFTGKINIDFSKIPNLWFLQLSGNSLGSSEPGEMNFIDSMINCSKLETFSVEKNLLRGMLPKSIGNLSSQLWYLGMSGNFIHGPLPSELGNLVKLEKLDMRFNHLTGIIPRELGHLQNLKELVLKHNRFTGNFPEFVGNLSLLINLDLSVNRLQGQIPPNLGNCKSLTRLSLSVNNLTGPIPIELFQLSTLSIILNLSQNHLVGPLPNEIGKLKSLTTLDLSHNDLVGAIPNAIGSCTSLEYLDLKENSFAGPLPLNMRDLRGIRHLDLSSNNFSGQIPRFLEQLNLSSLNLSFNNFDGEVPMRGIFKNASAIALDGNNRLCGGIPELRLPKCNDIVHRSNKSSKTLHVVLVVILVCSFLGVAISLSLFFCRRRRKPQGQPSEVSLALTFPTVPYESIVKATIEFSQQNVIGTGHFSVVYKGILEPDGAMVAIKVLNLGNHGALKSFLAECETLKNIRHRNLVKIISSCSSVDFQGNEFKALIYEFMPNGNLERWLHPIPETEEAPRRLNFKQRLAIAIDVAHAIHYLHQEGELPIIHCDLKPSNILLDGDMVAHIGDFGLAKFFLPPKPHQSSSIGLRGTTGYAAPEYGLGSKMTIQGDVYSFGILLLEMMTGKRPSDPVFQEGLTLHGFVKMVFPDGLLEIIEPVILVSFEEEMEAAANNYGDREDEARKWKRLEEGMISMARIGLACSNESPEERMDTNNIIHELHRITGVLEIN